MRWKVTPLGHELQGEKEATMAKDPVCGMEVQESAAAGRAQHDGKTYYFCSEQCRQAFERAPQSYVSRS